MRARRASYLFKSPLCCRSRLSRPTFSTRSVSRTASSSSSRSAILSLPLALEGPIDRPAAEKKREHRIRAEASPVDGDERGVLADLQGHVDGLAEERVVGPQAVRPRRDLVRD